MAFSVEGEDRNRKAEPLETLDVKRCVKKQPTKWRSGMKYVVVSNDDDGSTKTQGDAAQSCGTGDKDAEVIQSGFCVLGSKDVCDDGIPIEKSSKEYEAPENKIVCKNEKKTQQSISGKGNISSLPKGKDRVSSCTKTVTQRRTVEDHSRVVELCLDMQTENAIATSCTQSPLDFEGTSDSNSGRALESEVRQRTGPSDSLVRRRRESSDSTKSQKSLKAQINGNDAATVSNVTIPPRKSLSPKRKQNYAPGEKGDETKFAVKKSSEVSTSLPRFKVTSLNSQTKEQRGEYSGILLSASTSIEHLCERTSSVSRYDGSSDRLTSDKDTTPSKGPTKCELVKSKIHHRQKIHNVTSSTVSNEDFPSKRRPKTEPVVHDRNECSSEVNFSVNGKQRQRDETDNSKNDLNSKSLTQIEIDKNEIPFVEHDSSFKLDSDLEVPVSNPASKSLHELVESFMHDTSIVRRPCREFLDTSLYEEAKALHHRTLLKAVTAARKCSSSCMSSRATSVRTVAEQSTFELRNEGGASSDGSANRTGPRKVLKFDSLGRTPSSSSVKKNKSSSRRCGKGIAETGDRSLSVELFDLDDYLFSDVACGNNSSSVRVATPKTENRGLSSAADAASLKLDTSITPKFATSTKRDSSGASHLDVPSPSTLEISLRRSGNSPRTSKKDCSPPPLLSGRRQWEQKDEESATTKDKRNDSKGRDSLTFDEGIFTAKGRSSFSNGNSSFSCDEAYSADVGNVSPARGVGVGTISKTKSSCFRQNSHCGSGSSIQNTGFTLYDDFENISQSDTIFSTPKKTDTIISTPKKADKSVSNCDLSMNIRDDVFVAFDDLSDRSSKLKNNNSPLFKIFSQNEKKNFLSTESSSFIHNKFEDLGNFDTFLNENPKDNHKHTKKKKNNSNNNFCNGNDSYGSALNYDDFPSLEGDSPKLNRNSSRLNNSPSTPRSNGTPYNGGFSSLNGSSPTFVKRKFRFDENPRFDSNMCDLPLEPSPPNFDPSRQHSKTKNDFPTPKNPRRSRYDHGTVNDSQEFQPEDLFMYNDDMEDDPFSNSSQGYNGSDGGANQEEQKQECLQKQDSSEIGPCFPLNNVIKVTSKGVSFGALGCELSVGRKVEINLFGKKATLV